MTLYAVVFAGLGDPQARLRDGGDEDPYAVHDRFAATLAERGHRVRFDGELANARADRVVVPGRPAVDGPYAESAEWYGMYLVESEDVDDLAACCEVLDRFRAQTEIRAFVPEHSGFSGLQAALTGQGGRA
jgi:hypothetical protein